MSTSSAWRCSHATRTPQGDRDRSGCASRARPSLAIERGAPEAARRVDAGAGHHCLALRVAAADRGAWQQRLAQGSIEIERASDYSLYFRDPDGALVALSHWPEPVRGDAAV
jgi:hypothetical protein